MKRLGAAALSALLVAGSAAATEVSIDRVETVSRNGPVRLRVDSRARFDFDPATGTLRSEGSWVAQNILGPTQVFRLTHKFEDLQLKLGEKPLVRSYECVEGTFGETIASSLCGNYRFGQNGLDDGGVGDDIPQGPPKSLDAYEVSRCDWDGSTLVIVLSTEPLDSEVYPEPRITLTFTAKGAAARKP